MVEWLIEEGIGEHRALCLDAGQVIAARLDWLDRLSPGLIADAVLVARHRGSRRGTVRFAGGEETLIDGLPPEVSEGSTVRATISRAAMKEAGRGKMAQARMSDKAVRAAPSLAEALRAEGHAVRAVRCFAGREWEELIGEAFAGEIAFPGGTLVIHPTPAMTLIDIDGTLQPGSLALAAVPAIASAVRRFDIGGSIGVDFPTLPAKADRRAVDQALDNALSGWPHERTAMNGFGFVQLVARLSHPSILHRVQHDRSGAAARLLLRRAERVDEPGALLLTVHPAVRAAILPAWEADLARRSGREIRWQIDNSLAPEGAFAQAVTA